MSTPILVKIHGGGEGKLLFLKLFSEKKKENVLYWRPSSYEIQTNRDVTGEINK